MVGQRLTRLSRQDGTKNTSCARVCDPVHSHGSTPNTKKEGEGSMQKKRRDQGKRPLGV